MSLIESLLLIIAKILMYQALADRSKSLAYRDELLTLDAELERLEREN